MSPIYIIHCLDCGRIAEEYFHTIDVTQWKCEECGGNKMEKLPAKASFRLRAGKVGGFHHSNSETTGG